MSGDRMSNRCAHNSNEPCANEEPIDQPWANEGIRKQISLV